MGSVTLVYKRLQTFYPNVGQVTVIKNASYMQYMGVNIGIQRVNERLSNKCIKPVYL